MPKPPFSVATANDSPGLLLWQTTILWQRKIKKALEPYDVAHAQFVIMAILLWLDTQNQEPNQTLIAHWSKLDKMTVSKSLKKLASLNLITRLEHTQDTRAKNVRLTAKGKKLIYQLLPIIETIDTLFFGQTSQNNQKHLLNILKELTKNTQND